MNKIALAAACAAALTLNLPAQAQSQSQWGGYLTGALGQARTDLDCGLASSCDRLDTGYKLIAGVRLPNRFALEVSYFDWGKTSLTQTLLAQSYSLDVRARGVGLGAAYHPPLPTDWVGVLRAGVGFNRAQVHTLATTGAGTTENAVTETHSYPYIGMAIGYKVNPSLSIDGALDFTRIRLGSDVSAHMNEKADAQLFTLGVNYSF